jgi:hypothetical protein
MDLVTMYHPNLPGTEITVPQSAVPHHAASGWVLEPPEPPPAPVEADEPPAEPPPAAKKTAAKKTAADKKGD